ncbi:MAG: oligosaccharide flippase family protein [Longicatena sp.]
MSNQTSVSKKTQSIIAGGLISSAGIFFAKFIGLFYAVPYNTLLATADNIAYYGVAYQIYSYLLNICIAGFPFAIATLIAKYSAKGDYQTSLLIKKLSSLLMISFGFIMMSFVIVFATPLAKLVLPDNANNINTMRMVLILISFALFFVPILSSVRGFYQGLKHMEVYALSQVLEQIARIVFLLIASAIAIYACNADNVWALYFGVISTSIAAVLAIIHIKLYDKKQMVEIKKLARNQSVEGNSNKKEIIKELVFIAFPYLLVAILGYSDTIVNTLFLNKGLAAFGNVDSEIVLISGTINYGVLKLMSIPMILAPGFSAAIIPHITTALTNHDYKLVQKNIRDCIEIVLYIGLPISFCLFVFAKPIYAILFPPADPKNLELCAEILSWFSIEAFLGTIAPIFTSLLMSVGLRKVNIRNLVIMVAIKFSIAYPLLKYFGFKGIVLSSILAMGTFIFMNAYALTKNFHINWIYTFHKLLIILGAMLALFICARGLSFLGLKGYGAGRLVSLVQLAISGTLSLGVYFAITYAFQIPQTILHLDLSRITKKFKRG